MKHLCTLLFLFFCWLSPGMAQINPEVDSIFQDALQQYKDAYSPIGLSAAVRTDNAVWAGALGLNSSTSPLTPAQTFGMGSVSKTIASAVILQMEEEGLLSLDDPLDMYLDTFPNINPAITIRQLLNHTSGTYNYTDHPDLGAFIFDTPTSIVDGEDVLSMFVEEPIFNPGTQWSYSNTNYLLLGLIIEEISGEANYVEARNRFDFDNNYPSFSMPPFEPFTNDQAHLWLDTTGMGMPAVDLQAVGFSLNALFSMAGAAGAYVATPTDLTAWAYDLYSGALLDPGSMAELTQIIPPSTQYGLGVVVVNLSCGQTVYGHTGGIIYTTATFYDPDRNISVSVHCNDGEVQNVVTSLAFDLICLYDDYVSTVTSVTSAEELRAFEASPNPFSGQISFTYTMAERGLVQIAIFDELGRQVYHTTPVVQSAGEHVSTLQPDLPNGLYFAKCQLGEDQIIEKIVKY